MGPDVRLSPLQEQESGDMSDTLADVEASGILRIAPDRSDNGDSSMGSIVLENEAR